MLLCWWFRCAGDFVVLVISLCWWFCCAGDVRWYVRCASDSLRWWCCCAGDFIALVISLWFHCAGDVVVLVVMLLCWLVVFMNRCSGAFDETIWAHDACKKIFVFLLQRFALVVQEREYIRVRGFHLAFESSDRSMQVVHYWILPVVSHCQKWFLLPRDYDPVWLESGLVRVESTNQTQADFLVDCTSARWDRWDTRFGTKTSFTTSSWVNWNRSFVSNWDAICWDVLFRNVQFWITHKYLISVQTKPKWLRRPKAGTRTNGPTNSWSCLYSALDLSTARAGSEFHV